MTREDDEERRGRRKMKEERLDVGNKWIEDMIERG